jgi:hypothetical protein
MPTPRSGDGNRDAEAVTRDWVLDRVVEYQHWLEAKFHHRAGSPSRGQLDPTLVSGLIDPSVRAILFVTNGRISDSYMVRAERAFSRPPDRFVAFKEGPDLVQWLRCNKIIAERYFGRNFEAEGETPSFLSVSSAGLLDISDYKRGLFKPVSRLTMGKDYLLHLTIRSHRECQLHARFPPDSPLVSVSPDIVKPLSVGTGASSHCFRVSPHQVGIFDRCTIRIESPEGFQAAQVQLKRLTIRLDPSVSIQFAEQARIGQEIRQLLRSLRPGANAIACLYGGGGVGKTHVLDSLEGDLGLQTDFIRLAFSGQHAEDARLLCELVLFLHFGTAILDIDTLDLSLIASSRQMLFLGRRLVEGLKSGMRDGNEARSLIRDLLEGRDLRLPGSALVDPNPAATSVVVVADDVHKLRGAEADFFARVLTDHFNGSHHSILLLSGRQDEFESNQLETLIRSRALYTATLGPPAPEEVAASIARLVRQPCPLGLSNALSHTPYTTLGIINLLTELRLRGERLDGPRLARSLASWASSAAGGRDKVVLDRLLRAKDLLPLLDVVHAVGIGVPLPLLTAKFGSQLVDRGAAKRLLRLNADGAVVPFHDLVAEAYARWRGNCYTSAVGSFLAECIEAGKLAPSHALPALLQCGPSFEYQYLDAATAYRDSFIAVGRFGPALDLSKSIATILERRHGADADSDVLAEAWFVYAECLDHCSTKDDAQKYFYKAKGNLALHWAQPSGKGVRFEAESELFNLSFWNLEIDRLPDLRAFTGRLRQTFAKHPSVRQDRRFARAYLTALNRSMMFSLLADMPSGTLFEENRAAAQEFGMLNYGAFALVDYAKSTYHSSPEVALEFLNNAHRVFGELGTERRRQATSATEIEYLKCRLGHGSDASLSAAGRTLLEEGLWSEYLNAKLKLVAVLLLEGDSDAAAAHLAEFYSRGTALGDEPRRRFLLANLEAGLAFSRGDFGRARDWSTEHAELVSKLGRSYQVVAKSNIAACTQRRSRRKELIWYKADATNPAFLIESRIW